MTIEELAKILIKKLTKEELSAFCDFWDDGSITNLIEQELYPEDAKNFPDKYREEEDEINTDWIHFTD